MPADPVRLILSQYPVQCRTPALYTTQAVTPEAAAELLRRTDPQTIRCEISYRSTLQLIQQLTGLDLPLHYSSTPRLVPQPGMTVLSAVLQVDATKTPLRPEDFAWLLTHLGPERPTKPAAIDRRPQNTCEYLARIGFAWLLHAPLQESEQCLAESTTADHRMVLERMLDADVRPYPTHAGCYWLTSITWPDRVPRLATWSGQLTLPKLIKKYQKALRLYATQRSKERPAEAEAERAAAAARERRPFAEIVAEEELPWAERERPPALNPRDDLFAIEIALAGTSGIDPRTAVDPIDAGFSLHATDTLVYQRAALELLAIIGLQQVPLISFGSRWCGFLHGGRVWHFRIEMRAGGYYARWGDLQEIPLRDLTMPPLPIDRPDPIAQEESHADRKEDAPQTEAEGDGHEVSQPAAD